MKLFQPRFPDSVGGKAISFLRVIQSEEGNFVAQVTDRDRKEGKIIAVCTIKEEPSGDCYSFNTAVGYVGHRELCHLMHENGVKGKYREWLLAVEKDYEALAKETEWAASICFPCDLVEDKDAKGWKFKMEKKVVEKEITI